MTHNILNSSYTLNKPEYNGRLVNTIHTNIHLSDYRCQTQQRKTKTVKIDFPFNTVISSLASWSVQFGKKELSQAKLSGLSIQFGIDSYEDSKLIIAASVLLRDLAGDTPWSADIGINLLFFD